jgi:Flp pilus assembly pilin Flp
MDSLPARLWKSSEGQGIAEYAVVLAVVLTLVIGTVQMIALHANDIFMRVARALQ